MNLFVFLFLEIGFLILSCTSAYLNRGELIGWLFTALVWWQVYTFVKAIRETY